MAYLDRVRDLGWLDKINEAFAKADTLNILFVGETIIDEYRYVSPLAKPSKEFILATVEAREPEQFLGGVIAASLHADWKNAKVCTVDQPITKTRFVDADFSRKLFEVYSKQRLELDAPQGGAFLQKLGEGVKESDIVIVFDFGHGLMKVGPRILVGDAKFLAVNAQTNAGNAGFNLVSRYERADLICVDIPEARLATQMQDEDQPGVLMNALADRMDVKNIIITQGKNGSVCSRPDEMRMTIPAFASRAIDTIGAGDAFLATAAPLVAAGLDLEIAAFVGNVAGAIKTDIIGHRKHVERDELLQTIEALLK
jgi:bifunctional ADP-heptose synthase (sugar kinase/adenylyltransferase)